MRICMLLFVILCITCIVESHRRRNKKRKRKLWQKNKKRFGSSSRKWSSSSGTSFSVSSGGGGSEVELFNSFRHPDSEVVACEFSNSQIIERRDCPDDYTCTAGAFKVKFGEETGIYKFCNIPLKEEHLCKLQNPTTGNAIINHTCPEGVGCNAGPIPYSNFWTSYDAYSMYFCGDSLPPLPTPDVYERLLTRKACSVNGSMTNYCSFTQMRLYWWTAHRSLCEGLVAEINTNHGTDKLQFCAKPEDDDFSFIQLWGTPWYSCKRRWYTGVTVTRTDKTTTTAPPVALPREGDPPTDPPIGIIPDAPDNGNDEDKTTTTAPPVALPGEGDPPTEPPIGIIPDAPDNDNDEGVVGSEAGIDIPVLPNLPPNITNTPDGNNPDGVNLPESSLDNVNQGDTQISP